MKAAMLSITLAIGLVGCRTVAFEESSEYRMPQAKGMAEDKVETAMVKAGAKRGWVLFKKGAGEFEGELNHRGYYVKNFFAMKDGKLKISYQESEGLGYNGYSIHKSYYKWNHNYVTTLRQILQTARIDAMTKP